MKPRILGLLAAVLMAVPTVGMAAPISYRSVLTSTNGTANGTLSFIYDAVIQELDSMIVAFEDGTSGLGGRFTAINFGPEAFKVFTDTTAPFSFGISSAFVSGSFSTYSFLARAGSGPNTYAVAGKDGTDYFGNFSAATIYDATTAVPEPDASTLLIAALAAMGFAMRRRDFASSSMKRKRAASRS